MPSGSERAADTAHQLVSLNSRTVLPYYLLGRYYEGKKEIEEAGKHYRSASDGLEKQSSYPAVLGLARIAFAEGNYSESARYREELLERYPGQLVLELQTIEAYLAAGMIEESDTLLSDMIRFYPENAVVVCKRPLLLELYGRYDQAGRLAEALERSYGETSDLLLVKGRLLMQRGREDDSLALLEKGRQLYGAEPFFNAMYERTLIESGNAETAQQLLNQNRGGQTSAAAFEALLKSSIGRGDYEKASLYLSSLLENGGRKPDFLRYGISIAENLGQGGVAIDYARELASLGSSGPREKIRLAGILINFGNNADRREASALIDSLLSPALPPRERSILFYQKSRLAADRPQRLELLRSALLEDLQNTDALTAIARLYREQGELKKAYRYFSQAAALLPDNPQIAEELKEVELKLAGNEGSAGSVLRLGN
jgi:tetratricopeptide (TPR) repeat protein